MLDVTPEQLALIQAVLDEHLPGVTAWAFGSRVSGTAKPHSNLDLAVISEAPVPLWRLGLLEEAFAESDLPFRVDVIDWARTREAFRAVIRRNSVRLADDDAKATGTRPL